MDKRTHFLEALKARAKGITPKPVKKISKEELLERLRNRIKK